MRDLCAGMAGKPNLSDSDPPPLRLKPQASICSRCGMDYTGFNLHVCSAGRHDRQNPSAQTERKVGRDRKSRPKRPYSGFGALRPRGFWEWVGAVLLVIFGFAFPIFGFLLLGGILYIICRPDESPEAEEARFRAEVDAKRKSRLRWCPYCERNVRPVRPSPTAGSLLATGGFGYALRSQTACPLCRAEDLEERRL